MIGRLTGKVVAQDADTLVLEVGGVGYELVVPLGTLGRARTEDGRLTLSVHTHVREDALALFGFADETERAAFRTLIGISNVGPKIAVAVLGALPAYELGRVVSNGDLAALKGIPGVGKKIAERLLLELRDKLPTGPGPSAGPAVPRPASPPEADERLRTALTGMGFRPAEADRAIASLAQRAGEGTAFESLLRDALALLAK